MGMQNVTRRYHFIPTRRDQRREYKVLEKFWIIWNAHTSLEVQICIITLENFATKVGHIHALYSANPFLRIHCISLLSITDQA